jgi:anti-anti-sigma factor
MTHADVALRADDDSAYVIVRGEIDLANASTVENEIISGLTNKLAAVSVDLTGLSYVDSAGVRVLFSLAQRLELLQISLEIVVTPDSVVRRVIELSGLTSVVPLRVDAP